MKRLLPLLLLATPLLGQTTVNGRIMTGTIGTRPTTCSLGDQYNTTDGSGSYLCGPANVWVSISTGGSGGGGATLQTNSVDNTNQSILNLKNGNNMVLTPDAGGGVTFDATVAVQANGVAQTAEPAINFLLPISLADVPGVSTNVSIPGCVGVGGSHSTGLVPDPGAMVHSPHYYLDETCTWSSPTATAAVQNPLTSSGLSDSGSTLKVDVNTAFKGPNPYVDVTRYGARAVNAAIAPSIPGITGTITSTSTTLLLSGASTFQNGDGIVVRGAGATNTMSTPGAPTVTARNASQPTGTGFTVVDQGAGATTYSYEIKWRDVGGGVTAASTAGTVTTGQSSLGAQTVTLSNCSRSGITVTCTTSGAHNMGVGAMFFVSGTSDDTNFKGTNTVVTATDNTHFTYSSALDTANGASTSATGGTVKYFNCNHLVLPTPGAGVWQALIYGRSGGTYNLIGVSLPVNSALSGDPSYMVWDDFGATMMGSLTLPDFIPTSASASATNDNLVTTIVSGAGTTTLTLADAATNGVSGVNVLLDETPNILAAEAAARNFSTGGGMLYFPATSSGLSYVTNSYLDLTNTGTANSISQAGPITLGDTVKLANISVWSGEVTPDQANCPQFCFLGQVTINEGKANPAFYVPSASIAIKGLTFSPPANNYVGVFVANQAITMQDVNFAPGASGGTSDYMGVDVYNWCQSSAGGCASGSTYTNMLFNGGPAQTDFASATPLLISKSVGDTQKFANIYNDRRGFFFDPNQSGMQLDFDVQKESQGPIMPFITIGGYTSGALVQVRIVGGIIDTSPFALITNLGGSDQVLLSMENSKGGVGGEAFSSIIVTSSLVGGQNFGIVNNGTGQFGSYRNTGITQQFQDMQIGGPNSVFTSTGVLAAPTCSVATAGPPYTDAHTNAFYQYIPVWPNGKLGLPSLASNTCTTDGATQQATITIPSAVTGAIGYTLYINGSNGAKIGTSGTACGAFTTLSPIATANCGNSIPSFPGGGPAGFSGNGAWDVTHTTTSYQDFLQQASAPANPSSGYCRSYFDQSSGLMKALNSLGASCGPSGSGGGSANGPLYAVQTSDGAGNFVGIAVPASPNNVTQIYTSTPSGGTGQTTAFLRPGIATRKVTGASDTIAISDLNNQVLYTNGGAVAVSVPAPSTSGWSNPIFATVTQVAGTAVTFTPTSGTINGSATFPQATGVTCTWKSTDNTNWDNVVCPNAASVTGTGTNGHLTKWTGTTSVGNGDLAGGDVTTSGGLVATIVSNAVTPAKAAASLARRVCDIPVGDTSSSTAIANAQLGPQSRLCYVPAAATIVEIDVAADSGTPNVIVGLNHAGSISNLLSSALSTASSGGIACSNAGGTTGLDGATTCSATLQNTSAALGDYIELVSGTAGGTAKLMTIHVIYSVTGSL